jgi:hypothetical protein
MAVEPSRTDDDLDLPPLDGVEDEPDVAHEELELPADHAEDALDDAVADDAVAMDEVDGEGAETGLLLGSEESAVDVGPFDLAVGAGDGGELEDEEPEAAAYVDDELGADEPLVTADAGEEGPASDDEELREEDLPALDADDDGDVDEDGLYDRAILGTEDELRWDDRAWAKVPDLADGADEPTDDSGALAVPGDDPRSSARDATWKRLDETGRVTAATLVPGGAVILAMNGPERPVLVRIDAVGVARIVAEIDARDDDADPPRVLCLRWDAQRGWLFATGAFGSQVFRPA